MVSLLAITLLLSLSYYVVSPLADLPLSNPWLRHLTFHPNQPRLLPPTQILFRFAGIVRVPEMVADGTDFTRGQAFKDLAKYIIPQSYPPQKPLQLPRFLHQPCKVGRGVAYHLKGRRRCIGDGESAHQS